MKTSSLDIQLEILDVPQKKRNERGFERREGESIMMIEYLFANKFLKR